MLYHIVTIAVLLAVAWHNAYASGVCQDKHLHAANMYTLLVPLPRLLMFVLMLFTGICS